MAENTQKKRKSRSLSAEVWRRLVKNKGAMVGMTITILLFLLVCTVDLIFDYDTQVVAQDLKHQFIPPCAEYPFGTDQFGRNILIRILYGAKFSLIIAGLSTIFCTLIGMIIGSISGYIGGNVDIIIMRFCDIIGAIPGLLLGMVIVSALGASMTNLIIAMTVSHIPGMARVTRASILTVRNSDFVESAQAIGMPSWKIVLKYILPNCLSPIIVAVTLRVGGAVIQASSLSFLGLGVIPPAPEWGAMLSEGRQFVRSQPYITVFPGLAIMITVLALNMFGDGLRDAMDPKLRR